MKILFILHNPNNPFSGAVRVYQTLARDLERRGHTVEFQYLDDCRLPNNRLAKRLLERLALPTVVSRRASRRDLSGVDVVMSSSGVAAPFYRSIRDDPSRPVLVHMLHGLFKYDHDANLSEDRLGHWPASRTSKAVTGPLQINWDAAGTAASDVTVVQNLRDLSELRASGVNDRLVYIPPCVDEHLWSSSASVVPPEARTPGALLYFGTWESRKGSFYVPAAFRRIRSERGEATLTICGTGLPEATILNDFDPLDRGAVTVEGFISDAHLSSLMNACSIFLFPSLSEGFGLALMEALCFGLAAVTTKTGFGADFLTDGESAKIVFPSSEHIARAVLDLMRDDGVRRAIARNGREIARACRADRMGDAYERLFLDCLAQRATPAGRA